MPVKDFDPTTFGTYTPHPAAGISPAQAAYQMTVAQTNQQAELLHHLAGAGRKKRGGKRKRSRRTKRIRRGGGDIPFNPPAVHAVAPGTHYHPHETISKLLEVGAQHQANSVGDQTLNDPPIIRGAKRVTRRTKRKSKK